MNDYIDSIFTSYDNIYSFKDDILCIHLDIAGAVCNNTLGVSCRLIDISLRDGTVVFKLGITMDMLGVTGEQCITATNGITCTNIQPQSGTNVPICVCTKIKHNISIDDPDTVYYINGVIALRNIIIRPIRLVSLLVNEDSKLDFDGIDYDININNGYNSEVAYSDGTLYIHGESGAGLGKYKYSCAAKGLKSINGITSGGDIGINMSDGLQMYGARIGKY